MVNATLPFASTKWLLVTALATVVGAPGHPAGPHD
jgi:hypothetical protein